MIVFQVNIGWISKRLYSISQLLLGYVFQLCQLHESALLKLILESRFWFSRFEGSKFFFNLGQLLFLLEPLFFSYYLQWCYLDVFPVNVVCVLIVCEFFRHTVVEYLTGFFCLVWSGKLNEAETLKLAIRQSRKLYVSNHTSPRKDFNHVFCVHFFRETFNVNGAIVHQGKI